ncbi:unnamed protein product [Rangifer tarandus platyrhynchus]|uniref:Uncharacterized protein n=1 Tax=Rangifer tarandus platyrhynchus TaxID=3082113 RepID=A0ABN8ZEU2_RANTA|nr:unnamed protein product [Rangifer tarandus platyrhynchus]
MSQGFPGGVSGKEPACQYRRCKRFRFDPWVGKIHWRKSGQLTLAFLLENPHGQRRLVGYSPQSRKESGTTLQLSSHTPPHLVLPPFSPALTPFCSALSLCWTDVPPAVGSPLLS